jgi:hypothetical protein
LPVDQLHPRGAARQHFRLRGAVLSQHIGKHAAALHYDFTSSGFAGAERRDFRVGVCVTI